MRIMAHSDNMGANRSCNTWAWPAMVSVVAMTLLTACGGAQGRYADHMQRAKGYLAAGELGKASVEFRNALQIQPKSAEALYLDGGVSERRGNVREAIGLYQAAIDAAPDDPRARASLARILVFGAAVQRALEVIEPGLSRHPDDPDLLAARAAARHQLQDEVGARADAERAVQVAPDNENAISVLAALCVQAGESSRALTLVSQAAEKAPASVALHQLLAELYVRGAEADKAEGQMRQLIGLQPRDMAPRVQLAKYFVQAHKLDEAQRVLEDAVRDLPHSESPKLTLVDFIATQRSRQQGEQALRAFIARDPDSSELRFGLGLLLQRAGATQEAIATYREVVRREGTRAQGLVARDRIAALEVARGHYPEAQALIAEVLRENSRDNSALQLRAQIALEHDESAAAIADLRAVLQDQPQSIPVQRALARAYVARNEPALAVEALRTAMQSAPADMAVRTELAQLLLQSHRAGEAVALLEETVRRFPQESRAREMLVSADLAMRELPAARTAAEDLKTLRPEAAVGFYLTGLVAHEQQRFTDAQKNFERALELQPGAADILGAFARLDRARGNAAQAIARVQRAVNQDPKNVQALDLLGQLYLADGDLARATQTFTHATQIEPGWWVPYRDLALVRMAAKDPDGAIREYQAAVKVAPLQPQLVMELASLYEKMGRVDDAIARYEALYAGAPRVRQVAANNLAMLLVTYKADARSLERARVLTSGFETSDNGSFLDTQGWVRFKRGEFKEAVAELERAVSRAPDSKVIRYHLGMAEWQAGLRDRARNDLESALAGAASFSGSDEARQTLASLKDRSAG
jgi:tetratricopeptide (TPR) repeat protein